ncbi:PQQ-dependent sugar dehydrogenase [Shewanella maritima]|uniref:PQQ-dependent sugar dehydrogenase n=1 Tax=Shewanella maritima TaxID=2520507 RepID=UPI003735AF6F
MNKSVNPLTYLTTCAATVLSLSMSYQATASELPLEQIKLPAGFQIDTYAENVENARQMALGNKGTVFVGSRRAGNVYALIDSNKDFKADKQILLAQGLNMPSGLAYHQGSLYVAEVDKIWRYRDIENSLPKVPQPELVYNKLPSERHHGWKNIKFGPDGLLYIPVGAPCNVCDDPLPFSSIMKLNVDTKEVTTVAQGVRNSVGFDFHPETGELWFTDNGRDMMGDDLPDDELNRVTQEGQHFGFPYVHNADIKDPEFYDAEKAKLNTPPALNLGAHVAALGMEFYLGEQFPEAYRGNIFIAQHGSWNRSSKVGYRVMQVVLNGSEVAGYLPFATGWLQGEESWGRPVAVLTLEDGSLLVSDDAADEVYRISYQAK